MMQVVFYSQAKNNRDRLLDAVDQIDNLKFNTKEIDV